MAGVKISALPAVASAQLTDIFPVVQGGVTSKETLSQLATLFNSNLTYLPLAGGTMSGAINMGSHQINSLSDPTSAQDAATKNYVDNVALGGASPCVCTTTANLNTTYLNGVAGVGATLTDASGTFAAFSVDGQSPAVGSRVLVKNQSTTANNGIYVLTTNGDGISIPYVLTRATDYDTVANINDTGLIPVINGTVNANSAWYNTTKMVTVGTTAITFVKFGTSVNINKVTIQSFAAGTSTYTPTSGMVFATVEIVGGGASGGGVAGTANQGAAAGGGGGGGYCRKTYTAAQIGATATVVVGAGGAAPTAGNNNGNVGGNSTFTCTGAGATLTGLGGAGGTGTASSASPQIVGGGTGGTATNGDLNIPGMMGGSGWSLTSGIPSMSGQGGSSQLGSGGRFIVEVANANGAAGIAGTAYGSGGSGACQINTVNSSGGAGADGICYITEYISS